MITLKNGTVFIDNEFKKVDVQIDGEKIVSIGENLSGGQEIDCTDKLIAPSFMDSHVHWREPGQ